MKIYIIAIILFLGAVAVAWAVQWPNMRIPVGVEFTRDELGDVIEEEATTDGYLWDERDLGPRLPRS